MTENGHQNEQEWMTLTDAASALPLSRSWLKRLAQAQDKRIDARKAGAGPRDPWLVRVASVRAYIEERGE